MGILNAAVWCGSAIFLVFGLPAVFTPHLKKLLTEGGVGFAAESIVARYFIVQYCCGCIALLVLFFEHLYSGRAMPRLSLCLILGILAIALAGGLGAQPRMAQLHLTKYYGATQAEQRRAAHGFAVWHGVSESVNLVAIAGLIVFLWQVTRPAEPLRARVFSEMRS